MRRGVYPLAWFYVALFTLVMFACCHAGIDDPNTIQTTPVEIGDR